MTKFTEITNLTEKLINKNAKVKAEYYPYATIRTVDNGYIKLKLGNQYDEKNNSLIFSVFYIVKVKNPSKEMYLDDTFAWLGSSNISNVVNISCFKGEDIVIHSSYENEVTDNIIIVFKDSDEAELHVKQRIIKVNYKDILDAIANLDIDKFFNHFGADEKKLQFKM